MSYQVYELRYDGDHTSEPTSFDDLDGAEQWAERLINGEAHRNTTTIELEHWKGCDEPEIEMVRSWEWDNEAGRYVES